MSVPQFLIGIHWVFAGFPTLCPHCPPTIEAYSHDTISAICLNAVKPESSILKVGLQSKINKLKRSEYQRGLTARLESSVTKNTAVKNYPWHAPGGYHSSRGPLIFLDIISRRASARRVPGGEGGWGVNLYIKIDGGDRSFRGLKFMVWYLLKVWRYLLSSFRVLNENV